MPIPIENLYYLLSYAWNKLDIKDKVKVNIDDKTSIVDLFAKIIITSSKILLKRGVDKNYIDETNEITAIKGKLEVSATLKSNLLHKQKSICTYNEFSANILPNKILISTMTNLTRTKQLNRSLKKEMANLIRMFYGIELIEINSSLFSKVKITRNNRFYGFIMDVCKIVHESILPSEEKGKYQFYDFTKDDKKMNQLFEAFIRNFYTREQNTYKVKREDINWDFQIPQESHIKHLPKMQTDISLLSENSKIIIDAKFYRKTMSDYYDTEKIKSENLYQLFSYLLNQQDTSTISRNATGMLLYPTINKDYDLDYIYGDHKILIRTVNLNTHWENIHKRLKTII